MKMMNTKNTKDADKAKSVDNQDTTSTIGTTSLVNTLETVNTPGTTGSVATTWGVFKIEVARALTLVRYLLFYFARVVIGKGALKKPAVRNALITIAIITYIASVLLIDRSFFINSDSINDQVLNYIFVLLSVNTIFVSCLAVLVVKALTGTSANVAAVLDYLPVARYEKGRAYALLELVLIVVVMFLGTGIFLGAILLNYGFSVFGLFISCVFLPCITTTTVLVIVMRIVEFALSQTFLKGFTSTVVVFILAAITLLSSQYLTSFLPSVGLSNAGQQYNWSTFYYHLYDEANTVLFYGFALLVTVLLLGLLLFLPTPIPAENTVYINIPLGSLVARLPFGINTAQLIRHRVFSESIFLLLILGGYILWTKPSWSLLIALEPLVIMGMYHFANINPFIQITRPHLSNIRYYLSMYIGFIATLTIPAILLSLSDVVRVLVFHHQVSWTTWALTLLGVCITILVTLAIGILLPSHDDNPISAFLGLGTFIVLLFLFSLVTGLLGLNIWQIILAVAFCILAIIWQSIIGINTNRHTNT